MTNSHLAPTRSSLSPLKKALTILVLLTLTALAWLVGTGNWAPANWSQPSAYLEVQKSDVIGMLATFRAAKDGHYVPLMDKSVPELGAPSSANWSDIPTIEEVPMYLTGILARVTGIFVALNIKLLLAHLLAALAFYGVARYFRCQKIWAFVGGLAYGLAPFIFGQSPHHSIVAYVWHLPLFLVVWDWVATEPGLRIGTRKFWCAVAIAFITSLQNIYFTNIFCQLVLLGGVILFLRGRSRPALYAVGALIFVVFAGFSLMMVDTWVYHFQSGANPASIVRPYKWLEVYGLKIVDFFIPPIDHLSASFRAFASKHRTESILQDEGSYLGLVGIASLLLLGGTTAWNVITRRKSPIPLPAWQGMWVLVMFTTGGLNALAGSFGFTMFRASYRYSIVILAIVLLYAARWLSATRFLRGRFGVYAAVATTLIILWDQIPSPPSRGERNVVAIQMDSDQKFVAAMEEALPEGSMIFQLPIMDFPESPVPGLTPYEHLRPYLYSQHLRFSFGAVKGRPDSAWQETLADSDLKTAVALIAKKGFAALYINRKGFPDQGKAFLKNLKELGLTTRIDSPAGDLVCLILPPPSSP